MKISHLGHLVLTVDDINATIKFYSERLGMETVTFGNNRKALRFGEQQVNLHQRGKELEPKALLSTVGAADFCFVTTTKIEFLKSDLEANGVQVIEGPVSRIGATGEINSIYFRDPDQNLIEVSNYVNATRVIDKLAYIEIQNGKILVSRSKGKDKYYIPGGKRDPGENDVEALSREVQEELSVDLILDSIRYVGTFNAQAHGHADGVIVKMTCYAAKYKGVLQAESEIEELRWLNYKDMHLVSFVDEVIFNFLKEQGKLI